MRTEFAPWPLRHFGGRGAMLCHDAEAHDAGDREGEKYQLVQVADDGNEIGHEVDRRERVHGDESGERLRIPGNARIACREKRTTASRRMTDAQLLAFNPSAHFRNVTQWTIADALCDQSIAELIAAEGGD
jgi:hypothetical protein